MKCSVQRPKARLSTAETKTPRTPKHFSQVVNAKALMSIAKQICAVCRAESPAHWVRQWK